MNFSFVFIAATIFLIQLFEHNKAATTTKAIPKGNKTDSFKDWKVNFEVWDIWNSFKSFFLSGEIWEEI